MRKQSLEDNSYDLRRIPDYPGTGPFRHVSVEPEVLWRLEKNPDYWNPDLPYLDGIDVFHIVLGPKTGAACLANTIDFCFFIDPATAEKAKDIPGLNTAVVLPTVISSVWYNFNSDQPFSDVRVRQAMDLVLDKPGMIAASLGISANSQVGWGCEY